jgi:branched-subunit amino acid ABC-type transport system permease component
VTGLVDGVVGTAVALGVAYGVVGVAVAVVAAATRSLFLAVGAVATAGLTASLLLGVTEVTGVPGPVALLAGLAVGAGAGALLGPAVLARRPAGVAWPVGFVVAAGAIEALLQRSVGGRALRPDPLLLVPGLDEVGTVVVVGLPVAVVITWVVVRTRWGHRVRIAGSSPPAAARAGIRVLGIRSAALALAGAAAVLAAALAAPVVPIGPAQAAGLTVRGIAAAALLGRAGPAWALPGGLVLGLAEALGQRAWPAAGGEVAVALVVVAVLVARGADGARAWGRAW